MRNGALIGWAVALLAAASAEAGLLEYTSQNRYVRASANVLGQSFSQQIDAVGFSEFEVSLSTFGEACDPIDPTFCGYAVGTAGQHSILGGYSISAIGNAAGTTGPPVGSSVGWGESHFEVDFSVDEAVAYTLEFQLLAEFGSYAFLGPSLSLQNNAGAFQPIAINDSGTLLPGDYSFRFEVAAGGGSAGIISDYDLSFSIVPEPSSLSVVCGLGGCALVIGRRRRKAG